LLEEVGCCAPFNIYMKSTNPVAGSLPSLFIFQQSCLGQKTESLLSPGNNRGRYLISWMQFERSMTLFIRGLVECRIPYAGLSQRRGSRCYVICSAKRYWTKTPVAFRLRCGNANDAFRLPRWTKLPPQSSRNLTICDPYTSLCRFATRTLWH
jgi:hypothetical protein